MSILDKSNFGCSGDAGDDDIIGLLPISKSLASGPGVAGVIGGFGTKSPVEKLLPTNIILDDSFRSLIGIGSDTFTLLSKFIHSVEGRLR